MLLAAAPPLQAPPAPALLRPGRVHGWEDRGGNLERRAGGSRGCLAAAPRPSRHCIATGLPAAAVACLIARRRSQRGRRRRGGGLGSPVAGAAAGQAAGLPAPDIEGTRWSLKLDVGRTTFTFMPMGWAAAGERLELPMAVEFRPGGELAVLGFGPFLGRWLEPEQLDPLAQFLPALQLLLPRPPEVPTQPCITAGKWKLLEDQEGGRLVKFSVETNGFRRGSIWLPRGRLRFRAKAYGQILAPGKDATVTIRESRAFFGVAFGAFAGITMGPAAVVVCGLAAGWALRQVAIVVGRWSLERIGDGEEDFGLPPVLVTQDEPEKWQ